MNRLIKFIQHQRVLGIIVLHFWSGLLAFGQPAPVINNTLNTACADINPPGEMQLQFSPQVSWINKQFNSNGKTQRLDTINIESGFCLQFNGGFTKNLEWGFAMPQDVSGLSLGLKYRFGKEDATLKPALAAWVEIPTAGNLIRNQSTIDNTPIGGVGVILQLHVSEKFIIYTDLYSQKYIKEVSDQHQMNLLYNIDLDYSLLNWLRTSVGFAYTTSMFKGTDKDEYTGQLAYGFFFEKWENWNIYLAHYADIFGQNSTGGNHFLINVTWSFK